MSRPEDPRRLLTYGDDLEGVLRGALRAERADTVDSARLERIGQALSVAGAAAPLAPPALQAKAPSWLASKGALALLAAAAAIAGVAAVGVTSSEASRAPSVDAPPPAATVTVEPPVATVTAEPPTVVPADLPSEPIQLPSSPAKPRATASTDSGAKGADEIALLARAHDLLGADPGKSLALCREHEVRFSGGHFAQEREAVAIEALVYLGRTVEARRRLTDFRQRHPSSSHCVHLESLVPAAPSAP